MKMSEIDCVSEAEALFVKAEHEEEKGSLQNALSGLLQAAQLGHTGAQVTLGNWYSAGKGVPKSSLKAALWYKKAYRHGDESGALNLAVDKLHEGNTRSAITWLKRAIEMNSGEAAVELARLYLRKPQGKRRAIELLKKTQGMKRKEISDQAKEDAASLLRSITEA